MSQKQLELLEEEYLANKKGYQQGKETIYDFQRKAKQKTEELAGYINHLYRDKDIEYAKPYLDELQNQLNQMDADYKRQLAILDETLDEEKKDYLRKVSLVEEEIKKSKSDNDEM